MPPIDAQPDEQKKNKSLFAIYSSLMARYPYPMNASASMVIASAGVIVAQMLKSFQSSESSSTPSQPPFSVDWIEILATIILQAFWITPILLVFYKILSHFTLGGNLGKLLLDQLLFSPVFTFSIITVREIVLIVLNSSKGSLSDIDIVSLVQGVVAILPKVMLGSWGFWLPQRYFTLTFVPPVYHLVFGSACAFLWNIILALLLSK